MASVFIVVISYCSCVVEWVLFITTALQSSRPTKFAKSRFERPQCRNLQRTCHNKLIQLIIKMMLRHYTLKSILLRSILYWWLWLHYTTKTANIKMTILLLIITVIASVNVFSLIRQQGHVGRKTLHQQNPPVFNWRCWLTQVDLCNGGSSTVRNKFV